MHRLDFLKGVLPPGARYSLRYVKKRGPTSETGKDTVRNRMYSDIDEKVENEIDQYDKDGWNVYYATAGFGAKDSAAANNAVSKKELYIDVDCGEGKPYETKALGIRALRDFCETLKLPRPTLLDSGNGIHAHWFFKDSVPVHEWQAVADALKGHHIAQGFEADAVCTADAVRVLRVPGTTNFRGGIPTKLLTPVAYHEFSELRDLLGVKPLGQDIFSKARELTKSTKPAGAMTEVGKLIASNRVSKFEVIWAKSIGGTGCAQIKHAIENRETLPEPLWRGALSQAEQCVDRDWGIHALSQDHPDYSAEETEKKASETKGPYTCETYQKMETRTLCQGCPHLGKITAPIQLGVEFAVATVEDNTVVVNEVQYDIPNYPFPYYRGSHGGIYRYPDEKDAKDAEETGTPARPVTVYPHDIYAFARSRDMEMGDVIWVRIHMPKDGVREFMIPQATIGSIDKLRDAVNTEGAVMYSVGQLRNFQDFIGRQIQELQMNEEAAEMYARFGWTESKSFIVGNREYSERGARRVPIARHLEEYVRWMEPAGTLDEWKRIISVYEAEEFDMNAFGVCAAFGSILMDMSPEAGGLINFYSKKAGSGKTTILLAANSIFGHPASMMKKENDTAMSKIHRMGIFNGIATTMDEMTNSQPQDLSDLAYGSTQGRGRDRMQSSTNAERVNKTTWRSITLCTGNASFEDRLSIIKDDPQGEMARIIELYIPPIQDQKVLESLRTFSGLLENYGTAGDMFIRYVAANRDKVRQRMAEVQESVYKKADWATTDRFKVNILVCAITAGYIAYELELVNFNVSRIADKVIKSVSQQCEEQRERSTKASETFATYVNKFANNMLIINGTSRIVNMSDAPVRTPKGPLLIRYEPDTSILYISSREFNKWCAENFINAKEMKMLFNEETGSTLMMEKKRMGKGWDSDFGAVNAYVITNARKVLGLQDEPSNVIEADTIDVSSTHKRSTV